MIIPVRCFTCGKVIAHLWEPYQKLLAELPKSTPQEKIVEKLDKLLKFKRYCCKRMLVCHVEIIDKLLEYDKLKE